MFLPPAEIAALQAIPVDRDDQFAVAGRRFEIERRTLGYQVYSLCSEGHVTLGVRMYDRQPGKFSPPWHQHRKFVFRDGQGGLQFDFERNMGGAAPIDCCTRCRGFVARAEAPPFSPDSGFLHGEPVPELQGLTYAEEAVIARIQPIVACKVLSGGGRAMKGLAVYADRTTDVGEVANVLPRLPSEVMVVCVRRAAGPGGSLSKDLRVCRQKVETAFRWLVRNSPAYDGVRVDHDALEMYDRSPTLPVVEVDDVDVSDEGIGGPAPAQVSPPCPAWEHTGLDSGGLRMGGTNASAAEALRSVLGGVDCPRAEHVLRQILLCLKVAAAAGLVQVHSLP